jgi:two-component system, sensor histidine kinase
LKPIFSGEKMPWWTWVLPFPIFFLGTQLSLLAKVMTGSSLFYLPLAFAIVLIYWWGPRILISFYLNAVVGCAFWDLNKIEFWPIYALPETLFAFLSWLLFIRFKNGKPWLPNIQELLYFLIAGLIIPLVIYKFFLETVFIISGESAIDHYWNLLVATSFGDFTSLLVFATPLLFFASRWMSIKKLFNAENSIPEWFTSQELTSKGRVAEVIILAIVVFVMNKFLSFEEYWFLYGVLSLFTAIRFGFGITLLFSSYVLLLTYLIPAVLNPEFANEIITTKQIFRIQLGTSLLYVFSIITARVMSDMKATRLALRIQNKRFEETNLALEQANNELDNFVYSASHDLSAPLKSIRGLINISRSTEDADTQMAYLTLMEKSVKRLENFIREILDFSQATRKDISIARVGLKKMCDEVLQDIHFIEGFDQVDIALSELDQVELNVDETRFKIILHNLFVNAINYRRNNREHDSYLKVSAMENANEVAVMVSDNGEGIKSEYQAKIFNMFYRGTEHSKGSGLGLYNVREAAKKMNAEISFTSVYGEGTTFKIVLRKN